MRDKVYIVAALRTPFGKFGGTLKDTESIELCVQLIKGIVNTSGISYNEINQVHLGCCIQFEPRDSASPIIARQALLKAGLSSSVTSSTIDKACCSSSEAIKKGYDAIRLREAETVIVGGVDVMSRTPHIARNLRWGNKLGGFKLEDPLFPIEYKDFNPVALDAGMVALEYQVTREEQDNWALNSQKRYQTAFELGKFKEEIMPLMIKHTKHKEVQFDNDEFPKHNTVIEDLAKLPTIYGSPTVTAGNAPGLNDGAAMLILMSGEMLKEKGLTPLAEIIGISSVADDPKYIARVPYLAIQDVLKKARVGLDEIKRIEINEAFAAMPLVSTKLLGENNEEKIRRLREITNVNGGAIAIGHPVGASGARILGTLAYELRRLGGGYGVSAICGGLAQGDSVLIKV